MACLHAIQLWLATQCYNTFCIHGVLVCKWQFPPAQTSKSPLSQNHEARSARSVAILTAGACQVLRRKLTTVPAAVWSDGFESDAWRTFTAAQKVQAAA